MSTPAEKLTVTTTTESPLPGASQSAAPPTAPVSPPSAAPDAKTQGFIDEVLKTPAAQPAKDLPVKTASKGGEPEEKEPGFDDLASEFVEADAGVGEDDEAPVAPVAKKVETKTEVKPAPVPAKSEPVAAAPVSAEPPKTEQPAGEPEYDLFAPTPATEKPVPVPVAAATPAPAPAPVAAPTATAQPTAPAAEPPKMEELRANAEKHLLTAYALSPEDADKMVSAPEEVVPKLMAKLHMDVLQAAVGGIMAYLHNQVPQVVTTTMQQSRDRARLQKQFFAAWPMLGKKDHADTVRNVLRTYVSQNPTASAEQTIREAGAAAMIALRLPLPGMPTAAPAVPTSSPHTPLAVGGSSAAMPGLKKGAFEQFAEELVALDNLEEEDS